MLLERLRRYARNARMRSVLVVVDSSDFDDRFRFHAISEPLHAEAFIAKRVVEDLVGAVLPWSVRIMQDRVDLQILCLIADVSVRRAR